MCLRPHVPKVLRTQKEVPHEVPHERCLMCLRSSSHIMCLRSSEPARVVQRGVLYKVATEGHALVCRQASECRSGARAVSRVAAKSGMLITC